ncbi:MAG TPA: hypothetical protein VIJ19_05155, partial [Opitutaceae bacterium]
MAESIGLPWTGLHGLVEASRPAWDALGFLPVCVLVFELLDGLPGAARLAALVAAACAIAVTITADLLSLQFFHVHFTSVLPVLLRTHALSGAGSNLTKLVSPGFLTLIAAASLGAAAAFRRRVVPRSWVSGPAALVLLGFVVTASREKVIDAAVLRISNGQLYYTDRAGERIVDKPLAAA